MKTTSVRAAPQADVYSKDCPSRAALELVASKWVLLIIPFLAAKPVRNNELMRRVQGISQKMLTQTLRELERNGLVARIDYQSVPPRVEYQLTEMGRSLSQALLPVDQWAEKHHARLTVARQAFDEVNAGLSQGN